MNLQLLYAVLTLKNTNDNIKVTIIDNPAKVADHRI